MTRMTGIKFEELRIGMFAETTNIMTEEVVVAFADVSGDRNPVHLNAEYASTTPFKERIVHGALLGAYISALVGMELPGPGSIGVSLTLKFKRPVKLGAVVTTRVEVKTLNERMAFATLTCICSVNKKTAIEGETVVYVPRQN